jgi:hypothetical protein
MIIIKCEPSNSGPFPLAESIKDSGHNYPGNRGTSQFWGVVNVMLITISFSSPLSLAMGCHRSQPFVSNIPLILGEGKSLIYHKKNVKVNIPISQTCH